MSWTQEAGKHKMKNGEKSKHNLASAEKELEELLADVEELTAGMEEGGDDDAGNGAGEEDGDDYPEDDGEGGAVKRYETNPMPVIEGGGRHPETGKLACCGRNRGVATYCKNVPGYKTAHPGIGRCHLHGGSTQQYNKKVRYDGMRAGHRVGELIQDFKDDPAPHDMLNELAILRAIVVSQLEEAERVNEARRQWAKLTDAEQSKADPPARVDLSDLRKIIADIGGLIERMHRIRQTGLISMQSFMKAFEQVGLILASEVTDTALLGRIEERLMKIAIPNSYKVASNSRKAIPAKHREIGEMDTVQGERI